VGLSSPGLIDRIRRLEEKGVIRGYSALIAPEALGLDLTAFLLVAIEKPAQRAGFLKRIRSLSEVQECHQVTGEFDYLLKLRARDTRHLDLLINGELKGMAGIRRVQVTVALSTEKETPALPLPILSESESA
jgi:Lrp/AsnC family leucine-responsive transcriptional regulator